MMNLKKYTYAPWWNILLITLGSILFSLGAKAIVVHHNFITGGIYGVGLLIYYKTKWLSPGFWYLLFNLPLFAVGWFFVSRRFFLYSLYSVAVITVSSELIHLNFGIHEQIYAAIAGGLICGTGSGIILRSLGSGGGLDIIGVILNQKFNLGIGKFYLMFNIALFSFVITYYNADIFIASIILVFITSLSLEHMLALFNQRKVIFIVSDRNEEISNVIVHELHQGATFLKGRGVYSGRDKLLLMAITNNIQMRRIEEAVFNIDPKALFIVENSFNVIGSSFGERKTY
ncbi:YitT family protein [Desulfococcus sp.]|uniref:YitT family protein n=1 Tax=Desulfococcus sp. TaxID=2025834 RepID=UPI00359304E7